MQIKIGQIYKVKPEFKAVCNMVGSNEEFMYIRYLDLENGIVEFLDKNKIGFCITNDDCFEPEHLEPLEKTIYNLEVGDEIERSQERIKILGLIDSDPENPVYVLSLVNDFGFAGRIQTAKFLIESLWKIVQPSLFEEIKEMTVEEVSKLVGKKVKIVE